MPDRDRASDERLARWAVAAVTGEGGGPEPASAAEERSVRLVADAVAAVRAHVDPVAGPDEVSPA